MKPRILIIINRLVIGGQALDTVPLANALRAHFDIEVCYGEKEIDEEEALFLKQKYPQLILTKIPELKRSINWFNDIIAYKIIKKKIIAGQFDLVHTHGAKSGLLGRIAAWRCGVKHIVHTFHGHVFHSYYNRFFSACIIQLERWLGRVTTKVVAISAHQRKELAEIYKIVPDEKIVTIPLGVDIHLFNRDAETQRKAFRNQFELNENITAVSIIGRLVQVKNPGLFIRIVVKAIRDRLPVCFFVIGDGMLKQSMQHKLDMEGIKWSESSINNGKNRVIFTSWISNIVPAVQAMDVIVLTSFNEGTPLSIIEAQACGKPVVAADAGGVRDTFIHKETGFLIAQEDEEGFYEKLKYLIVDNNARHQMGESANKFATQHFSREAEIKNFTAFYNSQVLLHPS